MTPPENAEIAGRVRRVFIRSLELNLDPEEMSAPGDLSSVAGLDSLAILEFVVGLEEEFSVPIEPDRLNIEFISDLEALAEYFAERLRIGS